MPCVAAQGFTGRKGPELSQSARDVDWLRAQHVQQMSQGAAGWAPALFPS